MRATSIIPEPDRFATKADRKPGPGALCGREPELERLRELTGSHRLVTISGPGGIGKSRLALALSAGLLDDYPDGVHMVELAPHDDPDLVPQVVGAACGIRADGDGDEQAHTVASVLANRRSLVLLDNCEHLVASVASFVDKLLASGPHCAALITSREPLQIAGEQIFRLTPLPLEPAIQMFTDRAMAVNDSLDTTNLDDAMISQLCEKLDRLPLALELGAAQLSWLSPLQLHDRLDDRLRLLSWPEGRVDRHRTLMAMVEWSVHLLDEDEAAVLEELSIFAGGWTLEAAEAVCASPDDLTSPTSSGRW